jgi:hypothetical protein
MHSLLAFEGSLVCQEGVERCKQPPGGRSPGVRGRHACQEGIDNGWPPGVDERFPCQNGIGRPLSVGNGAHPPSVY